jgi:hypothetical protein
MNERILKIAADAGIPVKIAAQGVVQARSTEGSTEEYCVVSEEMQEILIEKGTIEGIKSMTSTQQIALANDLSRLIKRAGFVLVNFKEIGLTAETEENTIAFFSVRKMGLFPMQGKEAYTTRPSLEKCGCMGLSQLMHATENLEGLEPFHKEVERHYTRAITGKNSSEHHELCALFPYSSSSGLHKCKISRESSQRV